MFVKRLKLLHAQNGQRLKDKRMLEKIVVKYTVVCVAQYTTTLMVILLNVVALFIPVGSNIPRFIFEITWNICLYLDIITNIMCMYFQYFIGETDYYRCCMYCDNKCLEKSFQRSAELQNVPSISTTPRKKYGSNKDASSTIPESTRTSSVKTP